MGHHPTRVWLGVHGSDRSPKYTSTCQDRWTARGSICGCHSLYLIKKDESMKCIWKKNKCKQIFPVKYELDCVMTNIGARTMTMEYCLAVSCEDTETDMTWFREEEEGCQQTEDKCPRNFRLNLLCLTSWKSQTLNTCVFDIFSMPRI